MRTIHNTTHYTYDKVYQKLLEKFKFHCYKLELVIYMFCPNRELCPVPELDDIAAWFRKTGYPVSEPAALFKNWTSTLAFRVRV